MASAAAGTGLNRVVVPAAGGGGAGLDSVVIPAAGGAGAGAGGGGGGMLDSLKLRKIELETELSAVKAAKENINIYTTRFDIRDLESAKALILSMSADAIDAQYEKMFSINIRTFNNDNYIKFSRDRESYRLAIEFKTKENIEAELQTKRQELIQKEEVEKELVQKQETLNTELKKLELQIAKSEFASEHNTHLAEYSNFYGANQALNNNDAAITLASPFCDPVGFIQHTGECLTDSLIQMMLFGDGFKEITQPLFSKTTNDILTEVAAKLGVAELPQSIIGVFTAIKRRFMNRYKLLTSYKTENNKNYTSLRDIENLQERRSKLGICIRLPGPPDETRRMRRRASFTYARDIRGSVLLDDSVPTINLSNYWIDQFIKIFSLPFMYIEDPTYPLFTPEDRVKFFGKPLVLPSRPIACFCNGAYRIIHLHPHNKKLYFIDNNNKVGHATCFYKCNGKLVYYDDNYGIFEIPNNIDISQINAVIYKENRVDFANVHLNKLEQKSTAGNDIYVIEKITIIRDDGNKTFNNIQPIDYPFRMLLIDHKNYIINAPMEVPVVNSSGCALFPWRKSCSKGPQKAGRRRKTQNKILIRGKKTKRRA